MNEIQNQNAQLTNVDEESIDFDALERLLESSLEDEMAELVVIKKDHEKISNPEALGTIVMNVVWEQFINQVGVVAGEDFIKENRNLHLDLRKTAHIQTTDNFSKGKIATHNTKIDYQNRYDDWQASLEHNSDGSLKMHSTRTGRKEANLAKGARAPYDVGRPVGSTERKTDIDHTISAGEIIRDPAANAHLTQKERIDFANSDANLNEIDRSLNRSKKDTPMIEWLDYPNKNGQKPQEIFNFDDNVDRELRKKDAEARKEYKHVKEEGEKRSIEAGNLSRKEEAFRMSGKALRAALLGIIAEFIKKVIQKLIGWLRSKEKSLKTFIAQIKEAIHDFISNIKNTLITAADATITAIATAIIGPVVSMIKKAWIFLKQGYKSLRDAIRYIKDNNNKNKPFSILILEVGKIVMAGLTVGGAIVLGEVIEKALMSIPLFAVQIPLIGSLANILGLFFGSLIAGIIGALSLYMIDKAVSKHQLKLNEQQQFDKQNEILEKQELLIKVVSNNMTRTKANASNSISQRHMKASEAIKDTINTILENAEQAKNNNNEDSINNLLLDIAEL